ncbi:MAG: PAS domain S-box protein [Leeuwenhoekiella sp.]
MATDKGEADLLRRALERQKNARLQAEAILERKSKELYDVTQHLKRTNEKLENLLNEKTSELDGVFINIIDPYVVMDMSFNVINMNASAKDFLGKDHSAENINLNKFVHPDFAAYTAISLKKLIANGVLKNYRAKIIVSGEKEKWVQINASLIYNKDLEPIAAQGIIRDITEETRVREQMMEQKRQLDIIVENSPLGIVLSKKGKILHANPAFYKLLGFDNQELKLRHIADVSDHRLKNEINNVVKEMYQKEQDNISFIKNYERSDGTKLWAKTIISTVRNTDGEINYQVATIEDITKEREAQNQLDASRTRLSSVITNLNAGVLLENQDREIELTNQMFCNMFGIPASPQRLIGADCSNAAEQNKVYFTDPEGFVSRIEKLLAAKKTALADNLEMVDGRILERDFIPIYNGDKYAGHLWIYNDVTLRKKYRNNLLAQKEKYSSIIANMNLGLVEVDKNDLIQMVNLSFCNMSGYSEEELLGKDAREIFGVTEGSSVLKERNRKRQAGESHSYEIEVRHKNGAKRHWLISGAPRYDENGVAIGSIGIHLDITDQKNLELQKEILLKELKASNQGLQEYAHIVSHDLKSPLRSLSALATWISEDYHDILDENGRFNLQQMQEKIEGMDKLIDGILKYSSINGRELENSWVDVNVLIQEIKEIIFIPDHVHISIPEELPTIVADKTRLHQLFQNLMSNAVVNIEKEVGCVEIKAKDIGSHWQFSIADNGIGIPPEYHKKIFEIFQSIGNEERSTGIGLSIVKKIIDLYEGEINLKSAPEKGTTFYFTLKK